MRTIQKHVLNRQINSFVIQKDAKVLSLQLQHGFPTLWMFIPDPTAPLVERIYVTFSDGEDVTDVCGIVGTVQVTDMAVVHVFERMPMTLKFLGLLMGKGLELSQSDVEVINKRLKTCQVETNGNNVYGLIDPGTELASQAASGELEKYGIPKPADIVTQLVDGIRDLMTDEPCNCEACVAMRKLDAETDATANVEVATETQDAPSVTEDPPLTPEEEAEYADAVGAPVDSEIADVVAEADAMTEAAGAEEFVEVNANITPSELDIDPATEPSYVAANPAAEPVEVINPEAEPSPVEASAIMAGTGNQETVPAEPIPAEPVATGTGNQEAAADPTTAGSPAVETRA